MEVVGYCDAILLKLFGTNNSVHTTLTASITAIPLIWFKDTQINVQLVNNNEEICSQSLQM